MTKDGLIKIVSLKAAFNNSGLSDKLNKEFLNLVSVAEMCPQAELGLESKIYHPS